MSLHLQVDNNMQEIGELHSSTEFEKFLKKVDHFFKNYENWLVGLFECLTFPCQILECYLYAMCINV